MTDDSWLHLFTSNIRQLYVDDALSVVAGPAGLHYRFRYEKRYVADEIHERWNENRLTGIPVAVYFSLQHPLNLEISSADRESW
jgi:hypothetical protein